jgi:hypothetical protein
VFADAAAAEADGFPAEAAYAAAAEADGFPAEAAYAAAAVRSAEESTDARQVGCGLAALRVDYSAQVDSAADDWVEADSSVAPSADDRSAPAAPPDGYLVPVDSAADDSVEADSSVAPSADDRSAPEVLPVGYSAQVDSAADDSVEVGCSVVPTDDHSELAALPDDCSAQADYLEPADW